MTRYVVFLCLCSAMAYGQSAAPMAPPFSAVESAPHTVGQPGYVPAPTAPRSPNRRVLPETPETRREAGVWAGDRTRSSATDDVPPVLPKGSPRPTFAVVGVPLDLGPEVRDGMDASSAGWCMAVIDGGLTGAGARLMTRLGGLGDAQRACAVKAAFYFCMYGIAKGGLGDDILRRVPSEALGDDDRARVRTIAKAIFSAAEQHAARACRGIDETALDVAGAIVGGTLPKGPMPWSH